MYGLLFLMSSVLSFHTCLPLRSCHAIDFGISPRTTNGSRISRYTEPLQRSNGTKLVYGQQVISQHLNIIPCLTRILSKSNMSRLLCVRSCALLSDQTLSTILSNQEHEYILSNLFVRRGCSQTRAFATYLTLQIKSGSICESLLLT